MPRLKPPAFPAVCGLYGSPTVVNNIETIAVECFRILFTKFTSFFFWWKLILRVKKIKLKILKKNKKHQNKQKQAKKIEVKDPRDNSVVFNDGDTPNYRNSDIINKVYLTKKGLNVNSDNAVIKFYYGKCIGAQQLAGGVS